MVLLVPAGGSGSRPTGRSGRSASSTARGPLPTGKTMRHSPSPPAPSLRALVALLAVLGAVVLGASPGVAAPSDDPVPAVPAGLPTAIEPLAGYVAADSCDPVVRPGVATFAALLRRTWPGTTTGITRACGADPLPTSEHYDGRAVDWMVGTGAAGRARARALIQWLFAPDDAGNRWAMARRLGIMYLIWHNRIWGSYSAQEGWRPYSSCADHPGHAWDTPCHRDHVHVSFSWEGATGGTSFFTGRVAAGEDYGPCRVAGLNWAPRWRHPNTVPCPALPRLRAARRAPAFVHALVTWSGMALRPGMSGPAVAALNRALGVTGSRYDRRTRAAVRAFQSRHALPASGAMSTATWLALLPTLDGAPAVLAPVTPVTPVTMPSPASALPATQGG